MRKMCKRQGLRFHLAVVLLGRGGDVSVAIIACADGVVSVAADHERIGEDVAREDPLVVGV